MEMQEFGASAYKATVCSEKSSNH